MPNLRSSSVVAENSNLNKLKPIPSKIPIVRLFKRIAFKDLFTPIRYELFFIFATSIKVIPTK